METLQKENRELKVEKQMKILTLKALSLSNSHVVSEKFFKLITSLYAQKIKKTLAATTEEAAEDKLERSSSF